MFHAVCKAAPAFVQPSQHVVVLKKDRDIEEEHRGFLSMEKRQILLTQIFFSRTLYQCAFVTHFIHFAL